MSLSHTHTQKTEWWFCQKQKFIKKHSILENREKKISFEFWSLIHDHHDDDGDDVNGVRQ